MNFVFRLVPIAALLTAVLAIPAVVFADDCPPINVQINLGIQCHAENAPDDEEEDATETAVTDQFIIYEPPEDTLLGKRWYGRLADNANVYVEPSRAASVVRNVGDGYLFATINSWSDNEAGETWYNINYGEYVHADDITLGEPSDFRGVEITTQPQRPFGWVVVREVFPSTEPDGEPDESLQQMFRYDFVEIYDTVLGEDDWLWYNVGNGRWLKQTNFSIVDVDPRPAEVEEDEYWVEVDLFEQTFAAYEGDQMVYATLISSGLNSWPTYEGIYQVWDRWKEHKMSGAEGKADYYFLEDIPYIMYFDELNGIALHGTYWHDRFGYKHSHGCVNMTIIDAEWVFNWSAEAPNDLWVLTHTSDPMSHLE